MVCEGRGHMRNVRWGFLMMRKDEVFSLSSQRLIHYCNKTLIEASEHYEAYYIYVKYSLAASGLALEHAKKKEVPMCVCAFTFHKLCYEFSKNIVGALC